MKKVNPKFWIVLLVSALLWLPFLGARDLWSPNEPTYGLAAKEMHETGDWLIPSVGDEPFLEKPILYFWGARVTQLLFGTSEFTLRLPIALFALLSVCWVYRFAEQRVSASRASWAAAVFVSMFLVFWTARSIQMDSLVLVFVLGTVYFGSNFLRGKNKGWLAALCAGLGLLAKGPVVWVLAAMILVGEALLEGRVKALLSRSILPPLILALIVGSSWYVMLLISGQGDGLYEVFIRQNFARFVEAWDHQEPFYYYMFYIWVDFLPWVWLLPLAIKLPGRSREAMSFDRLSWLWIVVCIGFFSLSDSKRSAYLLPIAPAIAWLVASVIEAWMADRLSRARRRWMWIVAWLTPLIFFALGRLGALEAAEQLPEAQFAVQAFWVLGYVTFACLILSVRKRFQTLVPFILVASWLAAQVWLHWVLLPIANPLKSARSAAIHLQADLPKDADLAGYQLWRWRAGLRYYGGLHHQNLSSPEALQLWWAEPSPRCLFVLDRGDRLTEVIAVLGPNTVSENQSFKIGSREYLWVCKE